MPTVWIFDTSVVTATDPDGNPTSLGSASGGSGAHLGGIRIEAGATPRTIEIDDRGGRTDYLEDSEKNQNLAEKVEIDGVSYDAGTSVEAEFQIELTDSDGNTYKAWGIEVEDGQGKSYDNVVGLTFESDNVPPIGEDLKVTGHTDLYRLSPDNTEEFEYQKTAPCFTPGVLIETPDGPVPVEALKPGMHVFTADDGPQPILWSGARYLSARDLAAHPELRPIRLAAGAIGNPAPLLLSPQHRVGLGPGRRSQHRGAQVEPDGFARAIQLARDPQAAANVANCPRGVTYVHFLLPSHHLVRSDGVWMESLYPGPRALTAMMPKERREIGSLFPELMQMPRFAGAALRRTVRRRAERAYGPLARPDLSRTALTERLLSSQSPSAG